MASLTAETLVEAIDGPNAVGPLEGKSMPILTRLPNGKIGFRIMGKFVKSEAPAPVVRIVLESGATLRVGRDQIFLRPGGGETAAAALAAGDALLPAWDYPAGYRPPDLEGRREADGTLRVREVAADGEAHVFHAPIRETGIFFATCGALLKS